MRLKIADEVATSTDKEVASEESGATLAPDSSGSGATISSKTLADLTRAERRYNRLERYVREENRLKKSLAKECFDSETRRKFFEKKFPEYLIQDAQKALREEMISSLRAEIALTRARLNSILKDIDLERDAREKVVLWNEHDALQDVLRDLCKDESSRELTKAKSLSTNAAAGLIQAMASACDEVVSELSIQLRAAFEDLGPGVFGDKPVPVIRESRLRSLIWSRFTGILRRSAPEEDYQKWFSLQPELQPDDTRRASGTFRGLGEEGQTGLSVVPTRASHRFNSSEGR